MPHDADSTNSKDSNHYLPKNFLHDPTADPAAHPTNRPATGGHTTAPQSTPSNPSSKPTDWQSLKLPISPADIKQAAQRIKGRVMRSQCQRSDWLSPVVGFDLYLKRDHRQRTGSFKERGACNALLSLSDAQKKKGVIAASAGNHALALAHHGQQMGIPVTVVMPEFAPKIKAQNCRDFGAQVVLYGEHIGLSKEHAHQLAHDHDYVYINGYDDPNIIAGAGTIALEMLEQVPDLDALAVPVGGGGLIAGVGLAAKSIKPDIEIIGVEPTHAASYLNALKNGRPTVITIQPTLADGLAVPQVGDNAYAIASRVVDRIVTVTEQDIALAILRLIETEKAVLEGAGAASVAAALAGKLSAPGTDLTGKKVGCVLCGGNIDTTMLGRIIQRGLAADKRLCRFKAHISDRPGGLAFFARLLAEEQVSVIDITHDRVFGVDEVANTTIECTVETRDQNHIKQMETRLRQEGIIPEFYPYLRPDQDPFGETVLPSTRWR